MFRVRLALTIGLVLSALTAGTESRAQTPLWTEVTNPPAPRTSPGFAYDSARGRMVLFGGYYGQGGSKYFGDTFEWDGSTWTRLNVTGPSIRGDLATAYDSKRGRTVMFGGWNTNDTLGDTWEWDGATWTQVNVAGPAGRYGHTLVFDNLLNRSVLFGGCKTNAIFGDTWEWDGSAWTQTATTGPSIRFDQAAAYDTSRGQMVLFGGGNGAFASYRDTWEYHRRVPAFRSPDAQ